MNLHAGIVERSIRNHVSLTRAWSSVLPGHTVRGGASHGGMPLATRHGVVYSTDPAARNLLGLPWEEKRLETDLLLLCEDGSHGLDLSFVTHLFLVNAIRDPAKLRQVISRAHRMGATGPVLVQTLHMWND